MGAAVRPPFAIELVICPHFEGAAVDILLQSNYELAFDIRNAP